ncbi:MAG: hypothetical protein ACOX6S_02035 [Clostridia bacterium]|jgi:hypothetical protein
MTFSLKPDHEMSKKRYDAFWHGEIIDRPPVSIVLPKENPKPVPTKSYASEEERWLDVDFRAEAMAISLSNYEYYADSLPIACPNLGPEIFSAWCGCGYKFGQDTTWSEPCIFDWEKDRDKAVFDPNHPLFKTMIRFTEKLLEYGKGNFIVGLTDFHPGGDHLAALRDPQVLAIDMIENLDYVKDKLESSYKEYFHVYDIFYEMLREAGMPITSWTPLIHDGRYYIPSNDFSCMISKEMFDEVFLPGLVEECRFYERSIYHLDGPNALRHLDSILEIKELDAVQWVCGAGNEGYARWVGVYQKIQNAGKSLQLSDITLDELPLVFETLRPEGVWFSYIRGIDSKETADAVLKRISAWK